ncbi:hypothetical protein WDZ92_37830, partial [Nostoc sp. NIES-2111]
MRSTTRRAILKGAATLPAAALPFVSPAYPTAANEGPLQGTDEEYIAATQRLLDTMLAEDAALVRPGQEWLAFYRELVED